MTDEPKALLVDEPVINSPYEESKYHWVIEEGQPIKKEGRRPSGYFLRPKTLPEGQKTLFEEEFIENELVNKIREKVKAWRERGYPGVTPITRQLLEHWQRPDREIKLFFCQIEAAETIIWLVEAPDAEKQGIEIPKDEPNDLESLAKGYGPLTRYAIKMATGSGKTVVMAMLIAWSVINKVLNPRDTRFSDAVLIVCPNLTIKERLQVLLPFHPKNYYEKFDLVPRKYLDALHKGKYLVTNWHVFIPRDDSNKKGVLKRGREGDVAFCNRVLKELGSKKNILVINDEAHHAYRPKQKLPDEELKKLYAEERKRYEKLVNEATIWINGLDRINAVRGINFCLDFSATPFYIKGTGYEEGLPFPWVVSDFSLIDAIECGIVKIPQIPVDDNTGEIIPKYFHIWKWINEKLPASERQTARRRAKPEAVLREAEGAILALAEQWKKEYEQFKKSDYPVPPVMIIVCDNTKLSELIYEYITKDSKFKQMYPELSNNAIRIDSKLLEEAEGVVEGETKQEAAEKLRKMVDTIGKTEWEYEGDPPGKNITCVVAVSMLNEGWDANNVTQILGLRAFTSQLLCEQVVGRGLRRTSYDINPDTGLLEPEYVDVYGVPFEVIPVKRKRTQAKKKEERTYTLVRALPERKHLEIKFPRVEGYVFDVKQKIKCNVDELPEFVVTPVKEPTEVVVKPVSGIRIGRPDRLGPGPEETHYRDLTQIREQSIIYDIAAEITNILVPDYEYSTSEHGKKDKKIYTARHILFPQVLKIVNEYVQKKVKFVNAPFQELALEKYRERIVEILVDAIEPDTTSGEPPILPIIEKYRPVGSTSEVLFRTVRKCYGTTKSHVSHVVADSPKWEHTAAYYLEKIPFVVSYVKNDHLDFTIPYEYQGRRHEYRPDFIARLRCKDGSEINAIIEIKGFETDKDKQKLVAARKWIKAVNNHGGFGKWIYVYCRNPQKLEEILKAELEKITDELE